jgi:hypothetical protein
MNRSTVFQTDQDRCYNRGGQAIPCHGTGQDGERRCGRPWPNPRFITHGEIVSDELTGLNWCRRASPNEFPLSWPEAHAFIAALNAENFLGRNDWRLPQRRNLFSLVSHARSNPALPQSHPFVGVFHGYYWTASPCSRLPNQAWYIHLGGGRVFKGMKHGSYMVWPVCGNSDRSINDAPLPEPFSAETVCDPGTGLIWTRNADLRGSQSDWQGALNTVRQLNATRACGFSDWRLPNVRELESLVDLSRHAPAINGCRHFFNIRDGYWSSTTSVYDPSYAWVLYTEDGNVGVGYKERPTFYAWAVRSKPS